MTDEATPEVPRTGAGSPRRLLAIGALGAILLAALVPLSHVYSSAELVTFYGLGAMALFCEGAEWLDARTTLRAGALEPSEVMSPQRIGRGWLLRDRAVDGSSRGQPRLATLLKGLIALLVGYLLLVGVLELLQGLGGQTTAGSGSASDEVAAGSLLVGACALCLLAFVVGTEHLPGARQLRPGRPISWLALSAVLIAAAQNLSPQAAAQGVASTIARPVTASDLIVGSLPFGVVAMLSVGPVVRRSAVEVARRLGLLPLRPLWGVFGIGAGLLLVPVGDALFSTPSLGGLARFGEGTIAAAAGVTFLTARSWRDPARWLGRLGVPRRAALRWSLSLVGGLALATLFALVVGHLADALPADCVAQQQAVSTSLEGGGGRAWYASLGIAVAAGVDEELIFRGAIQPRLGLVATSLLFATFHLQYTCHGLPSVGDLEIVVLGLGFGLLRQRGGLLAAILAHVAYDGSLLLGLHL